MNKENIKKEKKKGAIKRLLAYILKKNKGAMVVISIAILFSAIGSISSSVAIKYVVDSIVTPALSQGLGAVTGKLIGFALVMGGIYLVGIVSATVYTQVLNRVTQKVMDDLRCDVFAHMQSLPIKYFDTNNHGDIMSVYTNDIETVRQVISESLPQLLVSAVMIVMLLGVMLTYSVWLTAVVLCCIAVMTIAARIIGGKSGKHFGLQQKSVGELEGYIEEMLQGQKVVKVFCHEKKSKEGFDEKNDKLFGNSSKAHRYANIMMPVMGNIGNIMYVLVAFLGTILVVTQATNVTVTGINLLEVGVVASFLNMGRSFSMQVAMVSQEVNFIALAQAGSSRVFALLDEESETDEGYVTLVNAEIDENGNITETDRRTDIWAWKHPHGDGTLTYTRLNGDILLDDVDFCYEEGKPILRNIDVYAHAGEKVAFVGATGAGKTTTLIALINRLSKHFRIGVMEADIDSDVDAVKVADKANCKSIQLHTGGMCHLDAAMTKQGLDELGIDDLDLVFLENVGNLVCPAEFDTGASMDMTILSVPEGDDKPLKYPLIYRKCDLVLINKIDAMPYFTFDMDRCVANIKLRNNNSTVIPISAKTGENLDEVVNYFIKIISSGGKNYNA